ncbi:hypothetical protein [Mesoplasma coleopterae]|uniref:hypothetical protein n=1 Tax=Mesoplasma coleopterae TaxID=324078 RepID=UPI000D0439A3|nr:hypothetical protein [Mesoplasma coleopterae]AVN63027.1 hypothetical protein CG000_01770 [Mesoplasma coleopterae]
MEYKIKNEIFKCFCQDDNFNWINSDSKIEFDLKTYLVGKNIVSEEVKKNTKFNNFTEFYKNRFSAAYSKNNVEIIVKEKEIFDLSKTEDIIIFLIKLNKIRNEIAFDETKFENNFIKEVMSENEENKKLFERKMSPIIMTWFSDTFNLIESNLFNLNEELKIIFENVNEFGFLIKDEEIYEDNL